MRFTLQIESVFRRLRPVVAVSLLAVAACGGRHKIQHLAVVKPIGDATCLSCHRQEQAFETTAHHLTSTLPTRGTIHGSFAPGENVLRTSNPDLHFRMDSTAEGFYQTAVMGHPPDTTSRTERFAFVVGSGRKGQSYLYWQGHSLFQLPVSYWVGLNKWINSPGYTDGQANFNRPITPRCLECHASKFESEIGFNANNQYTPSSAVLGVSCETCHGPGETHVTHERSLAQTVLSSAIVDPVRLPRARQLDQCALCHGGLGKLKTPAFSYVAGQPLEQHLELRTPLPSEPVDVHGNQVALLERSRCFQSSQMTCGTCHDVHRVQRDAGALSSKCLTCHTVQSCGLFPQHGRELLGKCVDCHMPKLTSNTIVADDNGRELRMQVRTHWIKVYPEATSH
jgi:cytochrome c554/c'-like protein